MTSFSWVLLCLLIFNIISFISSDVDKNFGGPYEINVYRFDHCESSGTNQIFFGSGRVNSYNRSVHTFTTNFTFQIPITSDVTVELEASRWGNGGWRPRYFHEEYPVCEAFKFVPAIHTIAETVFNVTDCPYPAGNYTLPMIVLEHWTIPLLQVYPYGKYRATVHPKKQETVLGCVNFYYDVVPKKVVKKKEKLMLCQTTSNMFTKPRNF